MLVYAKKNCLIDTNNKSPFLTKILYIYIFKYIYINNQVPEVFFKDKPTLDELQQSLSHINRAYNAESGTLDQWFERVRKTLDHVIKAAKEGKMVDNKLLNPLESVSKEMSQRYEEESRLFDRYFDILRVGLQNVIKKMKDKSFDKRDETAELLKNVRNQVADFEKSRPKYMWGFNSSWQRAELWV